MQEQRPRRRPTKSTSRPAGLTRINPNAAGIDCGSEEHYVAVPADRDATPVRSFKTFTAELHRLADWLTACGVTSVAMESTGVYWIPLYEILEARGIDVVLVNARHVKNVPGRKTDVVDCQWLQELHSVGLLRGSFRPTPAIATLRAYLRHRETLVQSAATHVQRMQKALVQMNLQLATVISDITGVTGLRILRDIVAGRTDPHALAQHRDRRCQASEVEIAAALTGHYRPEHVFVLQQNLELLDAFQHQLGACDAAIEAHLDTLVAQAPAPVDPVPAPRTTRKPRDNEPWFEIRTPLHQLTGVDLT
jgi:transposase